MKPTPPPPTREEFDDAIGRLRVAEDNIEELKDKVLTLEAAIEDSPDPPKKKKT